MNLFIYFHNQSTKMILHIEFPELGSSMQGSALNAQGEGSVESCRTAPTFWHNFVPVTRTSDYISLTAFQINEHSSRELSPQHQAQNQTCLSVWNNCVICSKYATAPGFYCCCGISIDMLLDRLCLYILLPPAALCLCRYVKCSFLCLSVSYLVISCSYFKD